MINLHNNTITTNKRKLCYLLTIPFLTLTNIPNIIFSYDNDVFAMAVDSEVIVFISLKKKMIN